jgi:hypothetical protein
MEFALPRPAGALALIGSVSRDAWRGMRHSSTTGAVAASRHALLTVLEDVEEVADQLADQVSVSDDSQPRANAASICRWELARLRERVSQIPAQGVDGPQLSAVVRHLNEGMTAAQILSTGYRFHSLDRICRGGRMLDDQFEALARLRIKLGALS